MPRTGSVGFERRKLLPLDKRHEIGGELIGGGDLHFAPKCCGLARVGSIAQRGALRLAGGERCLGALAYESPFLLSSAAYNNIKSRRTSDHRRGFQGCRPENLPMHRHWTGRHWIGMSPPSYAVRTTRRRLPCCLRHHRFACVQHLNALL